ncbi:hypothetical protein KIN20_011659 [Parelaphostrongylus tenuis]|uniref:Uncharacterized protein n=1 Tax=Parelaphostrongylus tenuis TaxID=148309 RepID=A0AAD5MB69_PARTN|nr:hypothetical protein KIN20_011659 [Parelaphostrongylus tenuis]
MDEADERNVGPLSTTRLPVERLFTMILSRLLPKALFDVLMIFLTREISLSKPSFVYRCFAGDD